MIRVGRKGRGNWKKIKKFVSKKKLFDKKIRDLETENSELSSDLEKRVGELGGEIASLEEKNKEINSGGRKLVKEIGRLEKELETAKTTLAEKEAEITSISENKVKRRETEIKDFKKTLWNRENQIIVLESDQKDLKDRIKKQEEELTEIEKSANEWRGLYEQLKIASLLKVIKDGQIEFGKKLQNEVETLNENLAENLTEWKKREAELIAEKNALQAEFEKELKIAGKLFIEEAKKHRKFARLASKLEEEKKKVVDYESDIEKATELLKTIRGEESEAELEKKGGEDEEKTSAATQSNSLSDWKKIKSDLVLKLTQEWQNRSFTHSQTQDWINVGLSINDANFAAWLRDEVQITPKKVLDEGDEAELRNQYQEWVSPDLVAANRELKESLAALESQSEKNDERLETELTAKDQLAEQLTGSVKERNKLLGRVKTAEKIINKLDENQAIINQEKASQASQIEELTDNVLTEILEKQLAQKAQANLEQQKNELAQELKNSEKLISLLNEGEAETNQEKKSLIEKNNELVAWLREIRAENSDRQEQNYYLHEASENWENNYQKAGQEVLSLSNQLRSKQQEINNLENKLENEQKEHENDIEKGKGVIQNQKDLLDQRGAEKSELTRQLSETERELAKKTKQVQDLEKEKDWYKNNLETKGGEIEDLETKLTTSQGRIIATERERDSRPTATEVEAAQEAFYQTRYQLIESQKIVDELRQNLAAEKLTEYERRFLKLIPIRLTIRELDKTPPEEFKTEKFQKASAAIYSLINEAEGDNYGEEKKFERQERNLKRAFPHLASYNVCRIALHLKNLGEFQAILEKEKQKLTDLETTAQNYWTTSQQERKELTNQKSDLEEKNRELKNKVNDWQDISAGLGDEKTDKEQEITDLKKKLEQKQENWENDKTELENQLTKKDAAESELRKQLEKVQAELIIAKEKETKYLKGYRKTILLLVNANSKNKKLNEDKDKLVAEKNRIDSRLDNEYFTNSILNEQLTNQRNQVAELETQKQELTEHLADAYADIENLRIQLANEKLVVGDFLDAQLRWYKNNFAEAYAVAEKEAEKNGREVSINEITSLLANQLKEEKEHLNSAHKDIIKLKTKLSELEQSFNQEGQQNLDFQKQIWEQNEEIEQLTRQNSVWLEIAQQELEETGSNFIDFIEKRHTKLRRVEIRKRRLNQIVSKKYEFDWKEAKEASTNAEQKNQTLESKNTELVNDLKSSKKRRSELKNKIIKINETYQAQAKKAQELDLNQDLIRHRDVSKDLEKDNTLNQAITQSINSLMETIANSQKHLGINDLTQIITSHPMPEGKSLSDLITFYLNNRDKAPASPNQPQTISEAEKTLINQIITECDLGLTQNSSLTEVIDRINQLIEAQPPVKPTNQPNDTPFGESLEKIIETDLDYLTKNLNLTLDTQLLKQAINYSQFAQTRNSLIEQYYKSNQQLVSNLPTKTGENKLLIPERIIWIGSLIVSLLVIIKLLLIKKGKRKN